MRSNPVALVREHFDYSEVSTGRLLYIAGRLAHEELDLLSSGSGRSTLAWLMLGALLDTPEMSMGQLAKRFAVGPSAVTYTIDRLAEDGLVQRHRPLPNSRHILVSLTPAGHAAAIAQREQMFAALDRLVEPLPASDRAELHRLLLALLDAASARSGPSGKPAEPIQPSESEEPDLGTAPAHATA